MPILEVFLSFLFLGFITWYGTGLDDLLFMSIVFKDKSHKQKVVMFFGNLVAVACIVFLAASIAHYAQYLQGYPFLLRIPGVIPIAIGFLEIKALAQNKRRRKIKRDLLKSKNLHLFAFAFFLYMINSVDDFVVTSSIFLANDENIKIFSYGVGFVLGSAISLYLASKFSRLAKKVHFLEFLAPVVIISIGTLILSGFFLNH